MFERFKTRVLCMTGIHKWYLAVDTSHVVPVAYYICIDCRKVGQA